MPKDVQLRPFIQSMTEVEILFYESVTKVNFSLNFLDRINLWGDFFFIFNFF
jgi:hypothetical protein